MDEPIGTGIDEPVQNAHPNYLVLFAVLFIAIGAFIYVYYFQLHKAAKTAELEKAVVSAGPFRASSIYQVGDKGELVPVQVTVNGKAENAIDIRRLADGSTLYILIDSTTEFISNLYRVSSTGDIEKITDTPTVKFNLSVNTFGDRAVYQEGKVTKVEELATRVAWDIVETNLGTKRTTKLTSGEMPHYTASGAVYFIRDGSVFSVAPGGSTTGTAQLRTNNSRVYAVNSGGTKVAFYNPITASIDVFEITRNATPSYMASVKVATAPTVLGFLDEEVVSVTAGSTKDGSHIFVSNYVKSDQKSWSIDNPKTLQPERLYEYE
jgi:hypothetical protein